jgi:hypothetical protein
MQVNPNGAFGTGMHADVAPQPLPLVGAPVQATMEFCQVGVGMFFLLLSACAAHDDPLAVGGLNIAAFGDSPLGPWISP